jgi:pimeloyl-ACP methyl ester carboxylesterase
VLCLHGYPDTAWTWRRVGPLLAERGYRVVAPFMRGYAPTDLAGSYAIGDLAADAVALRWALAGDGPAVLVGHDWGATAAYAVPAGVFDRIVTIAVPPPETLLKLPPAVAARQARASWYMLFQQLPGVAERSLDRLIPKLWRDWSPGYDATEDLAHFWAAVPDRAHRTAVLSPYRALRPWVRFTSTPTTYLHGARDGCVLPIAATGATLVDGAGHFVQLERPEAVVGYVI